ncbi:MAG: cytochrome c [Cyanobacteria bacterium SZAS LIN-5]|nr:cytochrome c [Cyanobacteria bacterium SZAS LIN-5]RTL38128.1 MAG: cytochrome c [Candidatus Melainabacteria bacterium]
MKQTSSLKMLSLVALMLVVFPLVSPAANKKSQSKKNSDRGAYLYMASCEPCHQTGGNMINPDKKIVNSDKITSEAVFKKFLAAQHAQMPPWKTIVKSEADLKALYNYVRKLK